jgi:glutathione S-transferase
MSSESKEEVKLIGFWVSPFSIRVEWALDLKGIEYEYIEEDIYNKSPLLLDLNPVYKKVPVFIHNGEPVLESLLIIEYIDEISKTNPLLPQDPYKRAIARFWANFAEEKLLSPSFFAMCSIENKKVKDEKIAMAIEALEKIEEEIKGKKFFGGDSIGYLDLVIGWVSYWLPVWEEVGSMKILDPLKFPAMTSWMNNFVDHPVIKNRLPPRDKMVDYFRKRSIYLSSTLFPAKK